MEPIERRTLGRTNAVVTKLGLGGAGIGDLTEVLSEQQAQDILQAAWEGGIRFFDTSPFYGHTKSEHRLGHFLRQQPRSDFVISTKVGRVFKAARGGKLAEPSGFVGALPFDFYFDYSYDGIMRSYEDSLHRLGLPSIDLLLIHDLDFWFHKTDALVTAASARATARASAPATRAPRRRARRRAASRQPSMSPRRRFAPRRWPR